MTDKTFIWIIMTSVISGVLAIVLGGLDVFFDSEILRIGLYLTFGTYAIVWGGACLFSLFQTAFQSDKVSKILGVISYVALVLIIAFSAYKY